MIFNISSFLYFYRAPDDMNCWLRNRFKSWSDSICFEYQKYYKDAFLLENKARLKMPGRTKWVDFTQSTNPYIASLDRPFLDTSIFPSRIGPSNQNTFFLQLLTWKLVKTSHFFLLLFCTFWPVMQMHLVSTNISIIMILLLTSLRRLENPSI